MQESNFIDGLWVDGLGARFNSIDPATNNIIWSGAAANAAQALQAVASAKRAFNAWANLKFEQRYEFLQKFAAIVEKNAKSLAETLSQDTGKPLWEAKTEITSIINKVKISQQAYADRCKELLSDNNGVTSITRHKPHGVVLVIAPFNFPGHIAHGHIIPALLAGNTVIWKPSELTPLISIKIMQCWEAAGIPAGIINLVQGGVEVSQLLTQHADVSGIFFTGSSAVGYKIQETLLKFPQRILALEMGGNNPLVVHHPAEIPAAVYHTLQSAFITAGQRCTCARRLIMVRDSKHEEFLKQLCGATQKISVGAYTAQSEPFMGPLISNAAVDKALADYNALLQRGAQVLVPLTRPDPKTAFLRPGIIDVTNVRDKNDAEIFAPLLSVQWVADFDAAIAAANNTEYGLAAGLLAASADDYAKFLREVRAGLINWNRPLTGSSSNAPFGGIGKSGNYRPSAYYAADYCAYPVASLEEKTLQLPATLSPGIIL